MTVKHSFGIYYNKFYIIQEPKFKNYYRMEPEEHELEELFLNLKTIIDSTYEDNDLSENFHPLLHHSRMVDLMDFPEIEDAFFSFLGTLPKTLVNSAHFPYDKLNMINGKGFLDEFHKHIPYFNRWYFHSVVLHPAKGPECYDDLIVEKFSDPQFLKDLRDSTITIAIENMNRADDYYGSLANLISLKKKISQKYEDLKLEDAESLLNRIKFTFDVGHLIKYICEEGVDLSKYDEDVKEFAQNIKVYHICTNTGTKDDHIALQITKQIIPADKEYLIDVDPEHELLINHTNQILKWLKICYNSRNPSVSMEYMLEQNDFMDPPTLQKIGHWILNNME